jgi:hypothetical protein
VASFTQAQLDSLNGTIALLGSVKSTTYNGRTVTYRDLDELLRLRDLMTSELAGEARAVPRHVVISTSKGL